MAAQFVFLTFLTSLAAAAAAAPAPTAVFVVGDSTASCGGIAPPLAPNLAPLNFSSFPSCPGRLLPDLLAERMGLAPPPPFGLLNGSSAELDRGINFGGHGPLNQQLRLAAEALQAVRIAAGPAGRGAADGAVFIVACGTDDLARAMGRGAGIDAVTPKHGRRGLIRVLADRIIRAVRALYDMGVKRVVVLGVGPLGCAPQIVFEGVSKLRGTNCLNEVNEVVEDYNSRLSLGVQALRAEFDDASVAFCSIFKGVMRIISTPSTFGFEDTSSACCGMGLFGGAMECLSREAACPKPGSHVWWGTHTPTESVNLLLANWSWFGFLEHATTGLSPLCQPSPLHELPGFGNAA